MVRTCCVPFCKSGLRANKTRHKISFHHFPNNERLKDQWLRAISRSNFSPTTNSYVCELHFKKQDFLSERSTTSRKTCGLKRKLLRDNVIPSVFPNYPSYMQNRQAQDRSGRATSASRLQFENEMIEVAINEFEEDDVISDIATLKDCFERLPHKPCQFALHPNLINNKLLFLKVTIDPTPKLLNTIIVNEDLTFVAYDDNENIIPISVYQEAMQFSHKLIRFTDFCNLLSTIGNAKALRTDQLKKAVEIILNLAENGDIADDVVQKLSFIAEQLQLIINPPGPHNRYSTNLLTSAILWKSHSTACYKSLLSENVLTLPSLRSLRRIAQKFSQLETDTSEYLKLRASKLNVYEKVTLLIFDEIHVHQNIEYSNGSFIGLATNDDKPATTLLCFMLKSLSSKFCDIVAAIPVNHLRVDDLKVNCLKVLKVVMNCGFEVVALCSDNHPVNRAFYKSISNDLNKPCTNPIDTSKIIFTLIDPIHTIKNIYNNFQKRSNFFFHVDAPFHHANFNHVKDLYELESSMSLRQAHKLNKIAISPTNIQRTSAKLAFSVFHDSTVAALKNYSTSSKTEWTQTADFVSYIHRLIKILNIRSSTVGIRRHDALKLPISSSADERLNLLHEYATFFQKWRVSKQAGLSHETFFAVENVCRVIRLIVIHVLEKFNFFYVLTGHIQSDSIESRFGRYRQMSGGNFFISVKQILENEKNIKLVSLLKHSGIQLSSIIFSESLDTAPAEVFDIDDMPDVDVTDSELEVIFYVAGYCAHTLRNTVNCKDCFFLISSDSDMPIVDQPTSFFDFINRGKLKCPGNNVYLLCCFAYKIFCKIRRSSKFCLFLRLSSPRDSFVKTVLKCLDDDSSCLLSFACRQNHDMEKMKCKILVTFFNCLVRNFLRSEYSKGNDELLSRKVAKLRSVRK